MKKNIFFFVVLMLLPLSMLAAGGASSGVTVERRQATPTATSAPMQKSWIMVDLPPDASQVEYGEEIYRLVCRDCHGDKGQGLTAEWRATWAPQHQNCWQSKCHAANHPPGGFRMPIAPPIVGAEFLSHHANAQGLYNYIRAAMPWYAPGTLTDKDAWNLTAFILSMNEINAGADLNPQTAAGIQLGAATLTPTVDLENAAPRSGFPPVLIFVFLVFFAAAAALFFLKRKRAG